jgi:hypothetical protein
MKKLIFAAFALLSITAQAQRELTSDSLGALTNVNGVFFQTRYWKYDNGEAASETTRIGDTATVRNSLTNQIIETANPFAAAALVVLNRQKDVNKMRDIATAMQAAIGVDVYKDIRALYFTEFVDTVLQDKAWAWRDATTNTPLQIRYMASGNIRISGLPGISGATRNVDIFGPGWIRIVNYPTGSNTNLYRLRRGRWFTLGRETEMRMNGVNLNSN